MPDAVSERLRPTWLLVVIIPALVTLAIMVWLEAPWDGMPSGVGGPVGAVLGTVVVTLIPLLPYLVLGALLLWAAPANRAVRGILTGYGMVMGAGGIIDGIDVLLSEGSTAVIALLFFPVLQFAGLLLAGLACVAVVGIRTARRRSHAGPTPSPGGP